MQPLHLFHCWRLRPLSKADASFLEIFPNLPEVRRYLYDGKAQTKADIAALLAENEQFEPNWLGFWLIATDTYGEVCMIGLFQNPVRPKENPRLPSELCPGLLAGEDGPRLPTLQTCFDR